MWSKLKALGREAKGRKIARLFSEDSHRADKFSILSNDLFFDFSKTTIDHEALDALLSLARAYGVENKRDAMFRGDIVNESENRPVLHTALRDPNGEELLVRGRDVRPGIRSNLHRMSALAAETFRGNRRGADGQKFTDVLNIGIGGSDLGPAMASMALPRHSDGLRVHFVSNIDSSHLTGIIGELDPATTLVIIASKTFTTLETITNAETARDWLVSRNPDAIRFQVSAVTAASERARAFGVDEQMVFGFEDWVGGRYSVWGPVGLSLMLKIGPEAFAEFLSGARCVDMHFRVAPMAKNLPVLMALVGIWHTQVCGYQARVVLPYEQRLCLIPSYLQQLEMESNGKSVAFDGSKLHHDCGPMIWGATGTNGQHAFFQWLHQGTRIIPCEFLVGARGKDRHLHNHHDMLVANCIAQSQALMKGRDISQVLGSLQGSGMHVKAREASARHRVFEGNRPSTTLIYPELTPFTLGQIIALYEHRVLVEGAILGINSFDQWGVELGKELARDITPYVQDSDRVPNMDSSTMKQLHVIHNFRSALDDSQR